MRIVSTVKSPSEDQALALVAEALKCGDGQAVAAKFLLRDIDAGEAARFLSDLQAAEIGRDRLRWMGSMDIQDMLMEGVFVESADNDVKDGRLAFLVPSGGGWKVDFDAFARTSKPAWRELLGGGAERAKVRVALVADSYYNGPFADESAWTCFGMTSPEARALLPEDRQIMYAYCRKDSPQARAMDRIVALGNPVMRVTLEVKRASHEETHQFEITRVFSEDWVMPDKPFDERFR